MARFSALPNEPEPDRLSDHTVIIGFGRVRGVIGSELRRQKRSIVIIEYDRVAADHLRREGHKVILGNAAAEAVLKASNITSAKLRLVTVPDGFAAGQIHNQARRLNPSIKVIARSHSEEQVKYLKRQGVDLAVMGEHELAVVMAEYSMRMLGVAESVIDDVLHELRRGETFSSVTQR